MTRESVVSEVRSLLGDFAAQQADALTDIQLADLGRQLSESRRTAVAFGKSLADTINRQLNEAFTGIGGWRIPRKERE